MDVGFIPAQLKTWLILPNLVIVEVMKVFTWLVELTSTCCVYVGVEHSDERASRAGRLMSQMERVAPREESLRAAARLRGVMLDVLVSPRCDVCSKVYNVKYMTSLEG